ncbi:MAG: molecular chaperone [Alphaproteobacteria bacterium]|nr:molecular chaperone [Alphaproteobacteria bacterium]MBV9419526.1 molecular chaperone [Alphaproteobacteria bacterium]
MKHVTKILSTAAFAALLSGSAAEAMSVTPVLVDLRTAGSQASGQIRVINTGDGAMPVSLTAKLATLGHNGELSTTETGADDLLVFPPQAIVQPNGTQVFRVQWAGDPDLKESKTFVIDVAQQPVAMPEGVSGIQLIYDFQVVVDVAPPSGDPALAIQTCELTTDDKGARRAALTITNGSNVHGYLSGSKLRLELQDATGAKVWSQSWTPEEIAGRLGIGLVQPHANRRFILPFDLPAGGTKLVAELSYEGRH